MSNSKVRTRFAHEARILASLNHPNIATIYEELQEAGGVRYLVLEYVPGQTLVERIAGARFKPQEALSIAQQIAEAVAAAHEHGIIHRDLKPGNIKITPEGRIKVLDFGLAKVLGGEAVDQQSTVTIPGRIMGTPAYMSPEQARGLETDERCDIWSFGCVLYEMLTGKVPFEGETISDILAGILDLEPDWHALPRAIPANIQVLLRRCLEKDSRRRLHDIADAAIEINETLNPPPTAPPVTTPPISLTPHIAVKARPRRIAMVIAATAIIALSIIATLFILEQRAGPASEKIRLVVLPFQNLGPEQEEYVADGITHEITTRLAGIHRLGVIARESAVQYKNKGKSAQVIGKELSVDYILAGTVQRERPSDPSSRVRITPRLIRASDDMQVWAEPYDFMGGVFQVQSDVAEQVAQALNIALVERERRAMTYWPTENTEAYEYYMQGHHYHNRSLRESDLIIAIQMYEKAVELDPEYALAYAQLSRCHAMMYWQVYDHTPERLEMAEKNVHEALQLEPDLPEAHLALGHYYYNCRSDWDQALYEFAIARTSLPNDSDLLSFIGYVQRRQGKFQEALANIKSASELASELNPRSNNITISLGETLMYMRNYPEAMRCFDKAISLAPDMTRAYGYKASLYLLWEGSTKKARAVVKKALESVGLPERSAIFNLLINLDLYDGNYQDALRRVSSRSENIDTQDFFIPVAMQHARIYGYMKDDLAKEHYEAGQKIVEAKTRQDPNDARLHSALGITYAGLGRKQDAIREGKLAVDLLPVNKDAMRGICRVSDLARIYVMVGDFDLAVNQIEFLLSIPSELSIPLLRLDPAWNPLRRHARFKKLIGGK